MSYKGLAETPSCFLGRVKQSNSSERDHTGSLNAPVESNAKISENSCCFNEELNTTLTVDLNN